jgi:FAD synthase
MLAEKNNGESVLITFDPHPRKVLYPETAGKGLKLINSQEEKLELLRKAGLDNLIIVRFTKEFSRITSEQFVKELLHDILHARVLTITSDSIRKETISSYGDGGQNIILKQKRYRNRKCSMKQSAQQKSGRL